MISSFSGEHPRSAARDLGIIHTDRFYRESAASLRSEFLPLRRGLPESLLAQPLLRLPENAIHAHIVFDAEYDQNQQ
jgi:hypothetical protein